MLHPGFLPILTWSPSPSLPWAELVSIYLEAERPHFLVMGNIPLPSAWLSELFALREQMEFEFILPADVAKEFRSLALGLHIPTALEVLQKTRAILTGKQILIGFADSYENAAFAEDGGADAIVLGPIFGAGGIGTHELAETRRTLSVPIFASGGIDAGALLQIKDAGAYGFCVPELIPTDENFEHDVMKLTALWEDFSAP